MSLLVIGTLAYDTIETVYDRREEVLGGSATYFATAASTFGPVELVGVVGRDFHKEHLEFLARRGVDTSGVEIAEGQTFRWSGRYEADWNTRRTLTCSRASNPSCTPGSARRSSSSSPTPNRACSTRRSTRSAIRAS